MKIMFVLGGSTSSFITLILTYHVVVTREISEICEKCPLPKSSSVMTSFCQKHDSSKILHVNHSCCVNYSRPNDLSIIALDVSGCGLHSLEDVVHHLHSLRVLMLENNTDLQFKSDDFTGMIALDYLSLPLTSNCPGGNTSWSSVHKESDKIVCRNELNLCATNNITCHNSNNFCLMSGPGNCECLCTDGNYGYKCLRQGKFPRTVYAIVLSFCTVVISALLWSIQRRKAIKICS